VNCSTLPYQLFGLLTIQQNDVVEMAHILLFHAIINSLMGVGITLDQWARQFVDGN
jgi:hypothetical protein